MALSNIVNLLGRAPKVTAGSGGVGNVVGPASSTDTALVRFSGTTGKIIQDSNVTLANSGTSLVFSGAAGLTASSGNLTLTPGTNGSNLSGLAGTFTNPSWSWTGDSDTGWYNSSANTIGFTSGGALVGRFTSGNGVDFDIRNSGAGGISINGTTGVLSFSNRVASYNGIATAGWGAEIVQGYAEVTAQSAAGNIATYTVGAADGVFRVSADMSVTAATVLSTTLTVTYTDKANVARTMILPVQQLSGSFIAGGLITATGAWETPTMEIRCKASTAITILTSAGTFNTVVFSAAGTITQVG